MLAGALGLLDVLASEALMQCVRRIPCSPKNWPVKPMRKSSLAPAIQSMQPELPQVEASAWLTAQGRYENASIELACLLDLPPGTPLHTSDHLVQDLIPLRCELAASSRLSLKNLPCKIVPKCASAPLHLLAALTASIAAIRGTGRPRLEAFGDAGYGGVWDTDDDRLERWPQPDHSAPERYQLSHGPGPATSTATGTSTRTT